MTFSLEELLPKGPAAYVMRAVACRDVANAMRAAGDDPLVVESLEREATRLLAFANARADVLVLRDKVRNRDG